MAIEKDPDGSITITGPDILNYRLLTLWTGLKLEVKGLSLCRGRSCYSVIKHEFGLSGNKARVLEQYEIVLRQKGVLTPKPS